jgi:hypothetical protein
MCGHPGKTIEDMRKLLLGYRDNMRVEIESSVAVTATTVADLRAVATWPGRVAWSGNFWEIATSSWVHPGRSAPRRSGGMHWPYSGATACAHSSTSAVPAFCGPSTAAS